VHCWRFAVGIFLALAWQYRFGCHGFDTISLMSEALFGMGLLQFYWRNFWYVTAISVQN